MPLGVGSMARGVLNRARRGLYAGRRVLSGNQVSEDGGNRTRRFWKPNAQRKQLFSELMGRRVQLRVTAAALRDIDKAGGIDAYILRTPEHKLQSDVGEELRGQLLTSLLHSSGCLERKAGEEARAAAAQRAAQRLQTLGMSPSAAAATVSGALAAREPA